ncbi:MAG: hypothetical protein K0R99_4525, partial [Microbacterium sp.]|nr:hypothetical protein [Microbacterium sp.]
MARRILARRERDVGGVATGREVLGEDGFVGEDSIKVVGHLRKVPPVLRPRLGADHPSTDGDPIRLQVIREHARLRERVRRLARVIGHAPEIR